MKLSLSVLAIAGALVVTLGPSAQAQYTFVGSWQVDQGPVWPTDPLIYTGQQAAALLFGGSPSDYAISTVDSNPTDINFMSWYSPWGGSSPGYTGQPNGNGNYPVGIEASESAFVDYGGTGHYDTPGDLSSYVYDWAVGPYYTNYAFRINTTPEPGAYAMLGSLGLTGAAFLRRRRAR